MGDALTEALDRFAGDMQRSSRRFFVLNRIAGHHRLDAVRAHHWKWRTSGIDVRNIGAFANLLLQNVMR
jgi:hypothetical protein